MKNRFNRNELNFEFWILLHLSEIRHARFLFHVSILSSLRQCVDSRNHFTCTRIFHFAHVITSISRSLTSLLSGFVSFYCLNEKLEKLVISTKKQALWQVYFLTKKIQYLRIFCFIFAILLIILLIIINHLLKYMVHKCS